MDSQIEKEQDAVQYFMEGEEEDQEKAKSKRFVQQNVIRIQLAAVLHVALQRIQIVEVEGR